MAASQPSGRSTRPVSKVPTQRQESWEQVAVCLSTFVAACRADASLQSQANSNDALRSPISLGNSFGLASLLQIPHSLTERSNILVEKSAELFDQTCDGLNPGAAHMGDVSFDDESLHISHTSAFALLDELKDLTFSIKSQLEDDRSKFGPESLSGTWRDRIQSVKDHGQRSSRRLDANVLDGAQSGDASAEELRKANAEYETWDLLRRVLEIRKPQPSIVPLDSSIQLFLGVRGKPHKHTPPAELWERFLLTDKAAREKKSILEWLECCSQDSDADVDLIVKELEESSGGRRGTWSHGFLYTRERIKAEKRRRGVGTYLESSTLRNSENTEPLVTQLDPDAPARQGRSLEKKDDYYDRSFWLACFAMLRRGMPWRDVRQWCEERREGWRAASFGMATDHQESKTGLAGPQAGALWRQMCLAAARHSGFDQYQRAVYGLLAGDIKSVDPICRSFDDLLYCRFNALLIRSFEDYLQKSFPDRFPPVNETHKFPQLALTLSEEDLTMHPADYVFKIATNSACVHEASDPYKILQQSIIGDDFQRLVTHLGVIIAHRANAERPSRLFPPLDNFTSYDRYECLADDLDVIRIIVHIYAIYLCVGYEFPESFRVGAIEHVIVAYIDYLRIQRKIETIPLYSTLLSEDRRWQTLGIVMVDVTDRKEQEGLVQLLMQQDANLPEIIAHQYMHAASLMGFLGQDWRPIAQVDMLEAVDDPMYPGFRLKRDFRTTTRLPLQEERLVKAVEWYIYVDAAWEQSFFGLSFALRSFLLSGNISGAIAITKRVPYKLMSLKKSGPYLGKSVDVFSPEAEVSGEDAPQLRRSTRTRASSKQPQAAPAAPAVEPLSEEDRFKLEMLRGQCRQYREMQQLCMALEQLALWNEFLDLLGDRDKRESAVRKEMNEMMADFAETVEPLLHGFMTVVDKEIDEPYYAAIRRLYVPSILLAYVSCCTLAANGTGVAERLVPALEAAREVGSAENTALAEDFVESRRMEAFVTAVANASKTLVRLGQEGAVAAMAGSTAGAEGKARRRRREKRGRGWMGETVEIWDPTRIV